MSGSEKLAGGAKLALFPGFYHLQCEKRVNAWMGTSREMDCPCLETLLFPGKTILTP